MKGITVEQMDDLLKEIGSDLTIKDLVGKDEKPRDNYEITRLLKMYDVAKPCPFKEGDFVTPRADSNLRRPGEPCLVVQAFSQRQFFSNKNNSNYLNSYDMIIIRSRFGNDIEDIGVYYADSESYEPYKGLVYGDGGEEDAKV